MRRAINLRQVEIFKAVIEHGTVSRASEILAISQPAASKHLVYLESDTGLKLFDRKKGRLAPTPLGLRFYEEIDRIFANVKQIETAVEVVKREERGQLSIGIIPALADAFIQRTSMGLLRHKPDVFLSISPISSHWVAEYVRTSKIDVGIVSARVQDPNIITEPLLDHPLVCIMNHGHELSQHKVIQPQHLDKTDFISFRSSSYIGLQVSNVLEKYNVNPNIVLMADASPTLRQFVAVGLGVSLVHPLFVAGMEDKLIARPFEPATGIDFLLCHNRDARNEDLIAIFAEEAKATASRLIDELVRS